MKPENDAPACPCPALDCERQVACRPPAPTCPHPFYREHSPEKVQVTRKAIDAFYARWSPGAVVVCDANTYLDREGGKGKPDGEFVVTGGKRALTVERAGENWHVHAPARVGDVISMTGDSITYVIATRAPHTVTWRIVSEADDA